MCVRVFNADTLLFLYSYFPSFFLLSFFLTEMCARFSSLEMSATDLNF